MEKHTDWRPTGDGFIRRFDPETSEWVLRVDPEGAAQRERLRKSAPAVLAALVALEQSYRDLTEQSDSNALDYLRLIRRGHGDFSRLEAARAAIARATGDA